MHKIEIIQVGKIEPHPNPEVERMEITHIWGWQCCIRKGQFKEGDKAIYIPPDYLVPLNLPFFHFLRNKNNEGQTYERIRVRRFKGELSQGLLINLPDELKELPVGTNVMDWLKIERYEPPLPKSTYGHFVGGPSDLYAPKFNVESYQRYRDLFKPNEEVIATEKIHGANARYVFAKNKEGIFEQYCGSRTSWMAEDDRNIWWMALRQCPSIGEWCRANPEKILYGEVFGQVQKLKYGAKTNDIFFAAFAIFDKNSWVDFDICIKMTQPFGLKWVPLLYRGPFVESKLLELAEGDSIWPGANHLMEGIVVTPVKERTDTELGRVCLKMVSNRYLESKHA